MSFGKFRPLLILLALVLLLLVLKQGLRDFRLSSERSTAALSQVFSPGEQIASALLGGFRSLLLNVLWVRIEIHREKGQYLELPVLLNAVEELQGFSPYLYQVQARMMVVDIPSALGREAPERWPWIRRGIRVLNRGLQRFPNDLDLFDEAGYIYFLRFHPEWNPDDRRCFMEEFEEDPLDISALCLERALIMEGHSFEVDITFWRIGLLRLERTLGIKTFNLEQPEVHRHVQEALRDESVRETVERSLTRAWRHLEHIEKVHVATIHDAAIATNLLRWINSWKEDLDRFRSTFLGVQ